MSLPAGEIERTVVDQIRCIGQDPDLLAETLRQARGQNEEAIQRLTEERKIIKRGLSRCHAEMRRIAVSEVATNAATGRVADLNDQVSQSERRLAEIDAQLAELRRNQITEADVTAAFADFDNVWTALHQRERVRLVNLIIHRVEFDTADSSIEVSFYPSGIRALASDTKVSSGASVSSDTNVSSGASVSSDTGKSSCTRDAAGGGGAKAVEDAA